MPGLNALMMALMLWIGAATGLPVPQELPPVYHATPQELVCTLEGISFADCDVETITEDARGLTPVAVYSTSERAIYLAQDIELASLKGITTLLHELVHHMQTMEGKAVVCIEAQELQAYTVELQWLQQHGFDVWKTFEELTGMTPFTMFIITRCTNGMRY